MDVKVPTSVPPGSYTGPVLSAMERRMNSSAKFWIQVILFQAIFGLTIFTFTRQYYMQDPGKAGATPAVIGQPSPAGPHPAVEPELTQFNPELPGAMKSGDPAVLARQADEFFDKEQYQQAADLYQQLLAAGQNEVDTYNNLGLTLHYLGRSTEALDILNKGVAVDSNYQRIWLTLGFVNKQLGNIEQARMALSTAVQLDAANEVGKSAAKMLEGQVAVTRRVAAAREFFFYLGGPGFWFGEAGLLSNKAALVTVTARTAVRALFLPAAKCDQIVEQEILYYRCFVELLASRYLKITILKPNALRGGHRKTGL